MFVGSILSQSKGAGDYFVYLLPSFVGSCCGIVGSIFGVFLGGFLIQRHWVRKANESAIIAELIKELGDLVEESLEYWSIDCTGSTRRAGENRQEARRLEQTIKGAIVNLNSLLRQYKERYCDTIDFTALMVEVSDACTGGQFEVTSRDADPKRILAIVNSTHRIRGKLLDRRV